MEDKIINVINVLSEKLGVATNYIYPLLIKQARIDAITGIFYNLLSIIMLVVAFIMFKSLIKFENERNAETNSAIGATAILLAIIGIIVLIFNFQSTLNALFNPEWYAINNILQQIK